VCIVLPAQYGGYLPVVKLLLQKGARADGSGGGSEIGTPLHAAANGGHIAVTSLLLDHGAETEATDLLGATVLHSAAAGGHMPTVQLLLLAGAETQNAFFGAVFMLKSDQLTKTGSGQI
jgi:ankyrin repeat protein